MILYATEAGVSVGDMFKAGIPPGILVGVMLMVAIRVMILRGEKVPAPTKFSVRQLGVSLKEGVLALIAPAIILVGMFSGNFSPTEAGVVAVVYSLIVGQYGLFATAGGVLFALLLVGYLLSRIHKDRIAKEEEKDE